MQLRFPRKIIFLIYAAYVLALIAFDFTGFSAFKQAANATASIAIVLGLLSLTLPIPRQSLVLWVCAGLMLITAALSVVANSEVSVDIIDYFKIASGCSFFFLGYHASARERILKIPALFLALAPILYWSVSALLSGVNLAEFRSEVFTNRNNAIFYIVVSTLILRQAGASERVLLGYAAVSALVLGTLGGALAIFIAAGAAYWRNIISVKKVLLIPVACIVIAAVGFSSGFFDRAMNNLAGSLSILADAGLDGILAMNYGEIARSAGTSDISLLFRIRHWANLLDIYLSGAPVNMIFGYGAGASVRLTDHQLLPHNDYIRLFFEFGAIYGVLFLAAMSTLLKPKEPYVRFVLLFFLIYMGSENLVNNFLCLSVLFMSIGICKRAEAKDMIANA